VGAWQSGAISRDTMFELFRSGEILPDGRTNQDEAELIQKGTANRHELALMQKNLTGGNGGSGGPTRTGKIKPRMNADGHG
jgi:hypothetical protein